MFLKEFPTNAFGSKPDYSGFDMESWIKSIHVQMLLERPKQQVLKLQ